MERSLAVALYLAAAGGSGAGLPPLPQPPAPGPVWLHAPTGGAALRSLAVLAARLAEARPGLGLILTHPAGQPPPPGLCPPGTLVLPALPDDPACLRAALARWRPGAVVLGDGPLPPGLVTVAAEAGLFAFLVDAEVPRIAPRWSALPGLQRALLRRLRRILVRDTAAGRAFRRAGARPWRIEEAGPLARHAGPLPHTPAERAALAARMGARPLWLAAAVPEAEEAVVLAAQRAAQRRAHRLLLIVVPADPARGPALAAAAEAMGLGCARRGAEAEPGEEDQVYVADTEGELGLWYRLAPVSLMGGTLRTGGGRDPVEAAALGSAIMHGPRSAGHPDSYARLIRARASWSVPGLPAATAAPAPELPEVPPTATAAPAGAPAATARTAARPDATAAPASVPAAAVLPEVGRTAAALPATAPDGPDPEAATTGAKAPSGGARPGVATPAGDPDGSGSARSLTVALRSAGHAGAAPRRAADVPPEVGPAQPDATGASAASGDPPSRPAVAAGPAPTAPVRGGPPGPRGAAAPDPVAVPSGAVLAASRSAATDGGADGRRPLGPAEAASRAAPGRSAAAAPPRWRLGLRRATQIVAAQAPPPELPDPVEATAQALAEAVIALLEPDRAAGMARAGWEVATEGAEATERAVDIILAALDGEDA